MSYFLLKYIHIFGACILFGTGLGIAFFMFCAVRRFARSQQHVSDHEVYHRLRELALLVGVCDIVVLADYIFTLTAAIVQPITGLLLVYDVGYSLFDHWVMVSLGLYIFIGICWIPVVFMQIEMRDLARQALKESQVLSPRFHQLYWRWFLLGWPAFLSILAIFALMIDRPAEIF